MTKILIVGPHPDDQELGMGGTIGKLVSQGHDILLLDMTSGEPTPHGSPEIRAKEAAAAAEILGVRRTALNLPNRYVEHSIPARHGVAAVIREHQAEIVFTPYFEDAHPDHIATTKIVEDARFDAKLTKIDLSGRTNLSKVVFLLLLHASYELFQTQVFLLTQQITQSERRDAIVAYESQFVIPENNQTNRRLG